MKSARPRQIYLGAIDAGDDALGATGHLASSQSSEGKQQDPMSGCTPKNQMSGAVGYQFRFTGPGSSKHQQRSRIRFLGI
jgi:hypothetical protein